MLSAGQLRCITVGDRPGLSQGNTCGPFVKTVLALAAVVLLSMTLTNMLAPMRTPQTHPVRPTAAIGSLGFADSDMFGWSPEDVNREWT